MAIHHATIKKAAKMGVTLTETEGEQVQAFWPKYGISYTGSSVTDAMTQMQALQAICGGSEYRIRNADEPRLVTVIRDADGHELKGSPMVPVDAMQAINVRKDAEWVEYDPVADEIAAGTEIPLEPEDDEDQQPVAQVERSESGVALDGAVAYREGTPAGDNPYSTETEDDEEYEHAIAWDEAWDAAADEAAEEENKATGSVVSDRYRTKYAEMGHPTTCGDWLATILDNLCITEKSGTDIDRFEAIVEANGVDLSRYNRTTRGWQGRLRMTGRNLLAKKVYLAGGILKTPVDGAEAEYRAPADWMAAQRYKMPKKDQNKPIPEAA